MDARSGLLAALAVVVAVAAVAFGSSESGGLDVSQEMVGLVLGEHISLGNEGGVDLSMGGGLGGSIVLGVEQVLNERGDVVVSVVVEEELENHLGIWCVGN